MSLTALARGSASSVILSHDEFKYGVWYCNCKTWQSQSESGGVLQLKSAPRVLLSMLELSYTRQELECYSFTGLMFWKSDYIILAS